MKTHHWRIPVWIACGMMLIHIGLLNCVSAQSLSSTGEKKESSVSPARAGINISELTDVNALGFLSPEAVTPWGRLVSDETERMLLAERDTVHVAFERGRHAKPGDVFTVFNSAAAVDYPLSGRRAQFLVSYLGRIVLKSEEEPLLFKAKIVEAYRPIQVGDPIFPFEPLSPCVRLSDCKAESADPATALELPVVAAKERAQVIGQYSVIYLDRGHDGGVVKGNLFQILAPSEPKRPLGSNPPTQTLGYVLVIDSRPSTSTGVVLTAKREFSVGTLLRPVALEQTLGKLLTYYGMEPDPEGCRKNPLRVLTQIAEKAGSGPELPEAFLLLLRLPRCAIP